MIRRLTVTILEAKEPGPDSLTSIRVEDMNATVGSPPLYQLSARAKDPVWTSPTLFQSIALALYAGVNQ